MSGSIDSSADAGGRRLDGRPHLLEFRAITKAFAGQIAVDNVSFTVARGEIHGLVGENGAGKTTLIKVLAGEYRPEAGAILLDGHPYEVHHPSQALQHGIGFIHQEPALVANLTIAENLALGLGFERHASGLIDWRSQRRAARDALARVGLDVDPQRRLEALSVADRQLVAIARILALPDPRVAVFDEATAPLTEAEVERLFNIVRELQTRGVGIIYVSHRLEEIFSLCDRVTVMRNGAWVGSHETSSLDQAALVRLIIGHEPPERAAAGGHTAPSSTPIASLRRVSDELLDEVSLDLYPGEILGLAGLVGAGRTNVLELLFGVRRPNEGQILIAGHEVHLRHPADAIGHGIAMVTEDRKRNGFIAEMPVWQNITLPFLETFTQAGLLQLHSERAYARGAVERFDIRTRSLRTPMRELSGGNQQKTILARWLSQKVRVLLLDEPTHGVDVGAKEEIYRIIRGVAAAGVGVLFVSSEFDELELLCSRALLLREGRIVGVAVGDEITKGRLLADLYQDLTEAASNG